MRLIVFYARAELRYRPHRMLAAALFFGVVTFCLTLMLLLVAMRAGEAGIAHLAAALPGSFFAIVALHALLLVCGAALLAAEQVQTNAAAYRILSELGVSRRRLLTLLLTETALLGLLGTAVFFPLAIAAFSLLTRGRAADALTIPWGLFAWLLPLLGALLLAATAFGCTRAGRSPRIHADGDLDAHAPSRPFADRFAALMRRRQRGRHAVSHALAVAVLMLPLFFLIAGADFGNIAPPRWDCTLTPPLTDGERGTVLYGIPDALLEAVRAIPGIAEMEVDTDLHRGAEATLRLAVRFTDEARDAGCAAIAALEGIDAFVLRDDYHAVLTINARRAAIRALFLLLALATVPAVLLLLALIRASDRRDFDGQMAALHGLGLPASPICRAYRRDALRRCLIDGALTALLAALLYAALAGEGGDTLPWQAIAAVCLPYFAAQLALGVLLGWIAYRRFLRERLNKTFSSREAWHEYHR